MTNIFFILIGLTLLGQLWMIKELHVKVIELRFHLSQFLAGHATVMEKPEKTPGF